MLLDQSLEFYFQSFYFQVYLLLLQQALQFLGTSLLCFFSRHLNTLLSECITPELCSTLRSGLLVSLLSQGGIKHSISSAFTVPSIYPQLVVAGIQVTSKFPKQVQATNPLEYLKISSYLVRSGYFSHTHSLDNPSSNTIIFINPSILPYLNFTQLVTFSYLNLIQTPPRMVLELTFLGI